MQTAYDPTCESVDVYADVRVDGGSPRRQVSPVVYEPVDGAFAVLADDVDGILQVQSLFVHDDVDHVVRVPFGLFDVVRKDVLVIFYSREQDKKAVRDGIGIKYGVDRHWTT